MPKSRYNKMDPLEHILHRSDTYVGSTKERKIKTYISLYEEKFRIKEEEIKYAPALLRIFIEALSNAIDNVARSAKTKTPCTYIRVHFDMKTGESCVHNDGATIPIEKHKKEKCYIHSLIFGQLLTSSNYDDSEDRYDISGRNGIGIKATSVFSTQFTVQGVDHKRKLKLTQTWTKNMTQKNDPVVEKCDEKGYTKITWFPDFKRFGIQKYSKDILQLYCKYVVDCAMLTHKYGVKVYFNDVFIQLPTLLEYSKLYFPEEDFKYHLNIKDKNNRVLLLPMYSSSPKFKQVSFVNGVYTKDGGTHVDAWTKTLLKPLCDKLVKLKCNITLNEIKKYFMLFVSTNLSRPEFESQSKNCLQSDVSVRVKQTDIKQLLQWPIVEEIRHMKDLTVLKRLERSKTKKFIKIEGFDPANNEGTRHSKDCTLILVEGLSAKTFAVQGIQSGAFGKTGRDWFGIYPLRGKLLNVRNAKTTMISKNNVISDIITILGIRMNVDYTQQEEYEKLRYGKVLILCDADVDGIHITGLIQNLFHFLYPSLLNRTQSYLYSMQTPIVRVFLRGKKELVFYDEKTYKEYEKAHPNLKNKYYKGLGSSSMKDIKQTFGKKIIEFKKDNTTNDNMNKVFNKQFSNQRKAWLLEQQENKVVKWDSNVSKSEIKPMLFSDYLNCEVKKFSIHDCGRSIPHVMDGLKESQRKVLHACFLKKLNYTGKTLKVAQLAGFVAEKTAYHHGEQNLYDTITRMANDYIGSNNVPYLYRDGQFGSRYNNGKDAANARYIFTKLDICTRTLFRAEDDNLLDYVFDDGEKVEPECFLPILPTILLNGCSSGIGTGWSCSIPMYNPKDLIQCVKCWLNEKKMPELVPWYRGFTGKITKLSEHKFKTTGVLEDVKRKKNVKRVTDLPIGFWTSDFKDYLDTLMQKKHIKSVKNYSTPNKVHIDIIQDKYGRNCSVENLKMVKYLHTSNMVLFTKEGIRKFNTVHEIIRHFCEVRFEAYRKRKKHLVARLQKEAIILQNKHKFLNEIIQDTFRLFEITSEGRVSRTLDDITQEFKKKQYDLSFGYEYMIKMQFQNVTKSNLEQLKKDVQQKQQDLKLILDTSEKDMWLKDIKSFQKVYSKLR